MTKTEIKQKAQDELMSALQNAFNLISESDEYTDEEKQDLKKEADKQMKRVEKLFGYEIGSWLRGT